MKWRQPPIEDDVQWKMTQNMESSKVAHTHASFLLLDADGRIISAFETYTLGHSEDDLSDKQLV